ncbi:phosphatidylinositol 3-kinase [Clonorchis sinensis]|uniref:Phosphatidylinositol 3-kinase n=1 Tax=Clonorchis sinensis TaxID=79923 RepID=A0A3R7GV76_CLOSI|nr:phosphatidylinositol 3-kinase [Clonorchis sinensis]
MVRLPDHQRRYTCCFCLHVRTGTILLGIGQIVLHLVCISLLILSALRPDMLQSSISTVDKGHGYAVVSSDRSGGRSHALSIILHLVPGISDLQDTLAVPPQQQQQRQQDKTNTEGSSTEPIRAAVDDTNAENDSDQALADGSRGFILDAYKNTDPAVTIKHRRHFSPYFALCLSTFSLAFCCFLVHGAVARQPTHLLPFFFLQVFDFIISLLTVVGYMSSTSDVRFWLHMKNGSMYINSTSLTFLMLSISCTFLAFKAYCLGMVWDCYKYLMLTYHRPDHGEWSNDPFSFFPSIWGFLGTGRRSSLFRGNARATTDNPLFPVAEGDTHGAQRPPATYDQSNDLPNYDDALKIPANAYAPPPYFIPGELNKTSSQTPPHAHTGDTGTADNINTSNNANNSSDNNADGSTGPNGQRPA